MSDHDFRDEHGSEPPPSPGREGREGREPGTARERFKSRLESVIPEVLKRAVEIGVEKARESPDNLKQFAHDMKLPKEVAHYLLQQIDETKNGLFRVVAKEIRDFLEHTNFSGELQKILTTVQFEVNTTIRFTPNDGPRKDKAKGKAKAQDNDNDVARDATAPDADTGEPPSEAASSANVEAAPLEADDDDLPPSRRPLPKPEVKTAVHVRRDARDAADRERRGRGRV